MNTCKTCRFWKISESWDCPPGFQVCKRAPMAEAMTMWDELDIDRIIKPEHADTMMCAQDASSYRADVYTRGDFYCPMWRAKDGS